MKPSYFVIFTALLCAATATEIQAGPREDATAGMTRCVSTLDDRARLNCYDRLVPQMRAALGDIPAAAARPSLTASVPQPPRKPSFLGRVFGGAAPVPASQFGMEGVSTSTRRPAGPVVDHITARVKSYSFGANHDFTVVLDNGQVWRQSDDNTGFATFERPASSYSVNIETGTLGSYTMSIQGVRGSYKVRRIS